MSEMWSQEAGERLRWLRERRGQSRLDLANAVHVGEATIRRLEAGETSVTRRSWLPVVEEFGDPTLNELVGVEPETALHEEDVKRIVERHIRALVEELMRLS